MQQMLPSKALLVSKSGATNFLSSHHGGCATSSRRSENVLEAASVTGMQAGFGVQRFLNFKATPDHALSGSQSLSMVCASTLLAGLAFDTTHTRRRRRNGHGKAIRKSNLMKRHLFGGAMDQLNPFYEEPSEQTRKKYQADMEAINALEGSFKDMTDEQLREVTMKLQKRAQSGDSLDSLLIEAFALVREASDRVLGLRHFDVQLIGGIALHQGNIAEMGTGEGKTLVAILPAFLNALTGKGVHVVTVNDYLARRDAEWVGQPLRFLGLTVGVIQGGMVPEQRKKAYRCDVSYVTNSELGFDYLRDQMAPSPGDLCLREREPFQFAVVDEVDSILIDEARTPLIISGTAASNPEKYQVAREVAKALRKKVHYKVDEKARNCVLIEEGVVAAEQLLNKDDLFDPQDPWFPFIVNALNAKELYVKDKQYIVKKKEVMIVDEFTGRVMDGRRWSNGLHQAVEAKEGVTIQAESVTMASISYQSLFRLFKKLGGMTGTAFTESKEFDEIYKLKTVVVPPNRNRKREDLDDQVYVDDIGKWKAVARDVERFHRVGRPVLIGTTNVENSEIIAELLDALGVPYQLLNAKPENVARETEIVAGSGRKYAVTIATNMAGRGTDILLGGNCSMMARMMLREQLYVELFPSKRASWIMPEDFYPVELSEGTKTKVQEAVQKTVGRWKPSLSEKPTSLDAAARILDGELTELEVEERLSLACEKAPTEDETVKLLRLVYQLILSEFKDFTDLEKQEVVALGGLYVVGTERHESRRIDNQLRGRCARQGDPGDTRFFLSLNDSIFRIFGGEQIKNMMGMLSLSRSDDTPLESGLLSNSLEEAQKKVENYFYSVRKNVFDYDDVMDTQRKIVYELRRQALIEDDEKIRVTLREFGDRNMDDFVDGHINDSKPVADWDLEKLAENVIIYCDQLKDTVSSEALVEAAGSGGPSGKESVGKLLRKLAGEAFDEKIKTVEESGKGLTGLVTRQVLLMQLDQFWQQHLKNMDFMKTGVTLRAYGQKNPLTEYKLEGYQVFLKMMSRVRRNAVYNMFLFKPRKLKPLSADRLEELIPDRQTRRRQMQQLQAMQKGGNVPEWAKGPDTDGAASRTINLARLALNVRQLLRAREELGELALASFGELRDTFSRAGLLTLGDQLRWAKSCSDFEMLEDEKGEEIYVGLRSRAEKTESEAEPLSGADERAAEQLVQNAMNDDEFVQTIDDFAQSPEAFLSKMKQSAEEQGWTAKDIQKLRGMYKASGVDIDVMLAQMDEASEDLPPAQQEVLKYMKELLGQDGGSAPPITADVEEKVKL